MSIIQFMARFRREHKRDITGVELLKSAFPRVTVPWMVVFKSSMTVYRYVDTIAQQINCHDYEVACVEDRFVVFFGSDEDMLAFKLAVPE